MKRILRTVLCLLLVICALLEPVSALAAAVQTELISEDVFLIPGPEDYFGTSKSISYNSDKQRLEYTFPAAVTPKTKMKLYAGSLEEDYGLTIKADKATDDGYMIRVTCGSKDGLRLEWFKSKKELVVFVYTRLLPKATQSDRLVLTLGAETDPRNQVDALVEDLDRKLSMTEKNASAQSQTRTFTKGGKSFLQTSWNRTAGTLQITAFDESILEALGLEERYFVDKNSAELPDLAAFLGRKCDSDQWGYARSITYSVEKTNGEKAFKEVLSLLKEDRYQLEQIKSWNYTDGSKKCTDYIFEYTGTSDDIDWVNHNDGYSYHVKLTKRIYSHKIEIVLYCWPEFYTEDPVSRSAYAGKLTPKEPEPEPTKPNPTTPTGGGGTSECKTCYGSGKCWSCSGKGGKYRNVIGQPWERVFEECRVCHNGKKCTACKGKGYK